jgi:D-alanyl-D-alanine carboxypeptidase (penicillin-binding protein 5/6)
MEYVGGSLYAFVRLMNARARQLGCADTSFSNAHGLPDDTQYSTAADLALIALEVSRNDLLARICATKAAELPETNLSPTRTVESTNPLINENSSYGSGYLFARANGLKTAYSEEAGFCLAASAADERCGIRLVSVVLGGTQTDAGVSCFTDTAALSSYVFDNYSYQEILPSKQNIASIDVLLGQDADYVNLHPASSISLLLPNDYDPYSFKKEITIYPTKDGNPPTAPISAGEVLGEVSVFRGGVNYGTVKLLASSSVERSRLQYMKSELTATLHSKTFRTIFWSVVALFGLYFCWVIIYRIRRLRHKRALRRVARLRAQAAGNETAALPQVPEIEFFVPETAGREDARPAPGPEAAYEPEPEPVYRPEPEPRRTPAPEPEPLFPFRKADTPPQAPTPAPAPAPASAPAPAPAPEAPAHSEDELAFLREQADRDYFEEFFRRK